MSEHLSSRRTVLKTAAWSAPVVALAVAAPQAAASGSGNTTPTCGSAGDNGTFTVTKNQDGTYLIVVNYKEAPDIYEANVRTESGSFSYGTNYNSAPAKGSKTWTITVPGKPVWIQIHTFNSHFGEPTCPAPANW
ncbi:hypothetical protein [Acidipropionibacterium jensenii]|uniref:hypothetical protein n=1 Tax=Acidipropionibacterium jensenii TaxID=1749 RepID=UPI000F831134|nr:hypothetical protein [Acidipropionibacterium jensenii]